MKEEGGLQVLIVDDHALMRKGIRSMLESYGDIQVVGEASNGIEAIMLMEKLHPRIVLMDVNMPKMNGAEATAQITNVYLGTIIIGAVSEHEHGEPRDHDTRRRCSLDPEGRGGGFAL